MGREELLLLLKLRDEASAGLKRFRDNLSSTGTFVQTWASRSALALGAVATAATSLVAVTGIKFNAMREQSQLAFSTMMKSGRAAKEFLDQLQQFAAKTPFEFQDLTRASQRLMAFGFVAKDIIPTMTAIGNAVSGLGGSAETIDSVVRALGQMQAKGKTASQEMMQMAEAGIPAWRYLSEALGTSVGDAMKKVENGAVNAKTTIDAVLAGMNKDFPNMMDVQSRTFNGLWSTIKDTFAIFSGQVMGPFFSRMTQGMQELVNATSTDKFKNNVTSMAQAMERVADWIIARIKDLIKWWQQHGDEVLKAVKTFAQFVGAFATGAAEISRHKTAIIAVIAAIGAAVVLSLGPGSAAFLAVVGIIALLGKAKQMLGEQKARADIVEAAGYNLSDAEVSSVQGAAERLGIDPKELAGTMRTQGGTIGPGTSSTAGERTVRVRGVDVPLSRLNEIDNFDVQRPAGPTSSELTGLSLKDLMAQAGGGTSGGTTSGSEGKKATRFSNSNLDMIDSIMAMLPQGQFQFDLSRKAVDQFDAMKAQFTDVSAQVVRDLKTVELQLASLDAQGLENTSTFEMVEERAAALKDALARIDLIEDLKLQQYEEAIDNLRRVTEETIATEKKLADDRKSNAMDLAQQLFSTYRNSGNAAALLQAVEQGTGVGLAGNGAFTANYGTVQNVFPNVTAGSPAPSAALGFGSE